MSVMATQFRCIIHGSFSKHFDEIRRAAEVFRSAGIEVLAPKDGELKPGPDGFALFDDEVGQDPRLVELLYLHNLKRLGRNGFSYFVNPGGYIGASASYELGIAQLTNVQCFFSHKLSDHPAYTHHRSVRSADALADYIMTKQSLPHSYVKSNERYIHKLWEDLMVPGSIVATGAIIEHQTRSSSREKEVLLVKTHKWGTGTRSWAARCGATNGSIVRSCARSWRRRSSKARSDDIFVPLIRSRAQDTTGVACSTYLLITWCRWRVR